MRFHYILRTNDNVHGGVCKKIKSQVQNLKKLGVTVIIHRYHEDTRPESMTGTRKIIQLLSNKLFFISIPLKLERESRVNTALRDLIRVSGKDDVLYFRCPFPSLKLSGILKEPRTCKIAIEYLSIETQEFRLNGEFIQAFIDFVLGGPIRKYSDVIVGNTDEITQYELKRCGDPDKQHITLGNGFDIKSANLRTAPPFKGQEISVLCVASVSRWHGIDRIIPGMTSYSGPGSIKLHIVGDGAEIPRLKRMAGEEGLTGSVIFHGFIRGTALDQVFDQCHIAVGSLGIHRKGLHETSELKIREYCSRGIPFILACSDPDFPDDFPYIHKIPADETPVSIDELFQFATRMYDIQDHPQKMHNYAAGHLDWSLKMQQLKQFLESPA